MSPATPRKKTTTKTTKTKKAKPAPKKKPATKPKTRAATKKTKKTKRASHKKSPIKRITFTVAAIATITYTAIAAYLYINQRNFIYFPTQGVLQTAEQEIELQNQNETLRGWVANPLQHIWRQTETYTNSYW